VSCRTAGGNLFASLKICTIVIFSMSNLMQPRLLGEFFFVAEVGMVADWLHSTSHDQKILVLDFAYDVDGLLFT
jgi:hypothetical protein